MPENKIIGEIATYLLLVGGLVWGVLSFSTMNILVSLLAMFKLAMYAPWIYGAVGAAAVYKILYKFKILK